MAIAPDFMPSWHGLRCVPVYARSVTGVPLCPPLETNWRNRAVPFQLLSWEGINIYEVISTSNEFTILVNDTQVDKAFRVIKDLKQL